MSASTEEVGAQVQEVVASSQGLAEMATSLRETVGRFRLDSNERDEVSHQAPGEDGEEFRHDLGEEDEEFRHDSGEEDEQFRQGSVEGDGIPVPAT